MAKYSKVVSGVNYSFRISFSGVSPSTETLVSRIQEWMRARKLGIGLKVELDGVLSGSKNPEFEAGVSPEHFQARLEDLAAFVGKAVGCEESEVLFGPAALGGGVVANFGLSEGYGATAKVHALAVVVAWLKDRQRAGGLGFAAYQAEPVTLVYGGWPEGDTVGTGCEPAVVIHLTGAITDDAGQVKDLLDALAGAFNQSRYYLEGGDQIAIFQRTGDTIPGQDS